MKSKNPQSLATYNISQCAESVLWGRGKMVDNGLHQTMLFHSPCYSETIDPPRKENSSQRIQLSWIKVYQCYQESLARSFCPRFWLPFVFRYHERGGGVALFSWSRFHFGVGILFEKGSDLNPSGDHNYCHQCTPSLVLAWWSTLLKWDLWQKRLRRAYPPPWKSEPMN